MSSGNVNHFPKFQIILDTSRSVSEQNSLKLNLNLDLVLENLKIMLIAWIIKCSIIAKNKNVSAVCSLEENNPDSGVVTVR